MQFPNIIGLIDEHLDRLIKVRRLLADLDLPATQRQRAANLKSKSMGRLASDPVNRTSRRGSVSGKTPKRAGQNLKIESLIRNSPTIVEASLNAASMAAAAAVMPREPKSQSVEKRAVVRTRIPQPTKKRVAPLKSPAKTNALALGGTIPKGPIVVSAQQIRIEHSLKQQEATVRLASFPSSNAIPLTAELLTQRWIQGSQSSAR
jgi:hypothetical protein